MKIKFLGTPECPDEIHLRGIDFPKGKAVEVDDEYTAWKCLNLPYFAEVKRGRKAKSNAENID